MCLSDRIPRVSLPDGKPHILTLVCTRTQDVKNKILVICENYVALSYNRQHICYDVQQAAKSVS